MEKKPSGKSQRLSTQKDANLKRWIVICESCISRAGRTDFKIYILLSAYHKDESYSSCVVTSTRVHRCSFSEQLLSQSTESCPIIDNECILQVSRHSEEKRESRLVYICWDGREPAIVHTDYKTLTYLFTPLVRSDPGDCYAPKLSELIAGL